MTTSKKCKQAGLKNLNELSEITTRSKRTLQNWNQVSPVFFEIVLEGAVLRKTKLSKLGEGDEDDNT